MELIEEPKAGCDVRDLRAPLAAVVRVVNSLSKLKIISSLVRNALTLTDAEGGTTLELMLGTGGSTAATVVSYPWQPYLSPWQGAGSDPNADTRKLRFRIYDGSVNGDTPSNMTQEFLAFGTASSSPIDEASSVLTIAYWKATISETTLGGGGYIMGQPQILLVQGTRNSSLVGILSPPGIGEDGSLPPYIVGQICKVLWYGGSLHFLPGLDRDLSLSPLVTGSIGGVASRGFIYSS